MIKPLLGAAFAIALTSAGAYTAFGHSGGSNPAFVPSVKVAPLQAGQDSQAKLAPIDPALSDESLANPAPTTEPETLDSKATYSILQLAGSQPSEEDFAPAALATNTTAMPSAKASSPNGPSSISVVTNANANLDSTALSLNAYNQALTGVTALNLPSDIKAQILQLMQSLRSQILAASISSQQSTSSTALVASVNAFLAQANSLNMNSGDRAKAYSALTSLGSLPGVNATFAALVLPTSIQPSTPLTPGVAGTQIQAQSQAIIAQVQANLDAQRKLVASLQNETSANVFGTQLNGMSAADFSSAVLNALYAQAGVTPSR